MSPMPYLSGEFGTALVGEIVDGPGGVSGVAGMSECLGLGLQLRRQIVAPRVAQ